MSFAIDIAWDRPTTASIKATGAAGVLRYLSPDPTKNLTRAEVLDYHANGLGTAVVWESTATRATEGHAAGVADAQASVGQAQALGLPADMAIHFAVDTDTDWASVEPYASGFASVVGQARTGVYGGLAVIDGAHSAGYRYLWQTLAWSGGVRSSHATLYQNGNTMFSGGADVNDILAADWGQYPRPTSTPPAPPATLILQGDDMPAGQLQPGFGADAKGNVTHPELASIVWLGGKGQGAVANSWLALTCDFGSARLRVAIGHPGGWDIRMVDVTNNGAAVWVANLPAGATHASILRVDRSTPTAPDKSAAVPVGYGTVMEIK